jgi:Fe-S-cluster containining protein
VGAENIITDKKGDCRLRAEAAASGLSSKNEEFYCVEGCVRCCADKGNPLELTIGDILRLCGHLEIGTVEFFDKYCEIMWNGIPGTSLLIPSVGLTFPCGFLKNDRCEVYDVRPIHCRLFPEALVMDNGNLDMYRNCGYECIDIGTALDARRKAYLRCLQDIDRHELKVTASYFDNFGYCVELKPQELKRLSGSLAGINNMEMAAKKRELYTAAIDKKAMETATALFRKKVSRLNAKFPKGDNGYLSAISKSFRAFG